MKNKFNKITIADLDGADNLESLFGTGRFLSQPLIAKLHQSRLSIVV